jgi:hypothetical protein
MKADLLTEKCAAKDPIDDSLWSAPGAIVRSFGSELELNFFLPTGSPFWFQKLP